MFILCVTVMHLKGIEKLREKLPDYPGNRIGFILLKGFFGMILGYSIMIFLDIVARILPDIAFLGSIEPYLPFVGSAIVGGVGILLIRRIWDLRDERKREYGDLAYQKMIPIGVSGVFLVPAVIFHAFTSIRSLPPGPPINDLTSLWSQSLLAIVGIPTEIDVILRLAISSILILIGILLVRSAILTFGIDYMTVVYLYFPEESKIQQSEIYSVIRHPAYLAVVLFGMAALFFRLSVYSIGFCVIIYALLRLHIRREERELIERFGDGYSDYMRRVPALYVRPKNYGKFFRFLRGSDLAEVS
ncbi:MAG: methyltransferase family protein [Promethearchaeota archaeon]